MDIRPVIMDHKRVDMDHRQVGMAIWYSYAPFKHAEVKLMQTK